MTMKPIGSVITTSAKDHSLQASIPHTETGAGTQLSTEKKNRAVQRLLQIASPATVDKSLVSSLESITGHPVIEHTQVRFPKDQECMITTTGFSFKIDSIDTCDKCIEAVQVSLTPMPRHMIEDQLKMMLALVVKPSGENVDDVAFRITAMANQLSEYPADIVAKSIEIVTKQSTFWPSFSEFWKHIEWRLSTRKRLIESLSQKKLALLRKK